MLRNKIQSDLIAAQKAREELKVSTLRLLTSAIKNEEINQRKGDMVSLDDDDLLAVIRKEVKQRNDAIIEYTKGARADLAKKESMEKAILETYLPAELGDAELRALLTKAVAASGATGPQDFGKAMKAVMAEVKGKASGNRVSEMLKAALTPQ